MMQEPRVSLLSNAGSQLRAQDQLRRRKITKRGFQLTVMVCGRSGLGKSSFINSLYDDDVCKEGEGGEGDACQGTHELQLRANRVDLTEYAGAVIDLSVVDTPGFGGKIDNRESCAMILDYLEAQFDEVLREEARVRRNPRFQDSRVHVCLYFLPPTPHELRELDIELMKTLSSRVNVLPVIAKADTLTAAELKDAKRAVMEDIRTHKIPIFEFEYDDEEDVQSVRETNELRAMMPFAVGGCKRIYSEQDELVRVRIYPWGRFYIENPYHCDFVVLRSVLLGSHLHELRDSTQDEIYEKYRTERLCKDPDLFSRLRKEEEEELARAPSVPRNSATPSAMASSASGYY